jgi:phosphoribosylanthranilate isomerase
VFVDQSPEYVRSVAALVGLTAVQLHGDEAAEAYLERWNRVIKAVPVRAGFDPVRACRTLPGSATMLLDAHDPIRRGGTGRTIDWDTAATAARLRPVILSGGLTPANVADALVRVRPYALDVSSGVESAPGVKDPAKLRAFFTAIASTHDTAQPEPGPGPP